MKTFIHQQYLSDLSLCDDIINLHKNSNNKGPGGFGTRAGPIINKKKKDSIDCLLPDGPVANKYLELLFEVVNIYVDKFPWCNKCAPWGLSEGINIQYYPPGGGYKNFHAERTNAADKFSARHLVFMTYLNDVTCGGGTEFLHQNLVTEARKGLTLIWPPDWTHAHRGVVSPTQEKYIITGWFSFMPNTSY